MENEKIGHFKILREIGRGGFGTVYLAYDDETNEHVALKKVENFSERKNERRGLLYYKKNRENFRYENIISITETIKIGGDMYYSMPIADGMGGVNCTETSYVPKTLELVIKERLQQGGGWFSEDEILDIIIPIARALATVDKCGLKHRDVKPANIIFVKGKPMLSDFGLAAADTSSLSRAGTADYTPPAWFSDSGGDPDMWGFAMTFFALFSGKPPSESRNNRKYPKRWSEDDLVKNRGTWDKFAQIVFRVKNENESERFPNWSALLDALYGLRGYADKYRPAEPQPPAKKRKLLNGCLALFLAALICVVGLVIFDGSGGEGGRQPQEEHPAAKPESENKAAAAEQEEKPKAKPENVKLVKDKLNAEIDKRTAKYKKELEEVKAKNAELTAQVMKMKSGTNSSEFYEEVKNHLLNIEIEVPKRIFKSYPVSEIIRILRSAGDPIMRHSYIYYENLTVISDEKNSRDPSQMELIRSGKMTIKEFLDMCGEQFGIKYEFYPFQRIEGGFLDFNGLYGRTSEYFAHSLILSDK